MEIIIATVIILLAIYILAKNIKKKTSGQCDCSSCHQAVLVAIKKKKQIKTKFKITKNNMFKITIH
nr:FeoB-associated Cys-rich membrane protein [Clostridium botulinum]